jgi:hypothetical protein
MAAREQTRMGLVILASSAGAVFEWYDSFMFGSLAAKYFSPVRARPRP